MDRRQLLQALAGLPFAGAIAPSASAASPQFLTLTATSGGGLGLGAIVMVCALVGGGERRIPMARTNDSNWRGPLPDDDVASVSFELGYSSPTPHGAITVSLGDSRDLADDKGK